MNIFSAVQFLNAGALALGLVAPLLVLAYLRRDPFRRVIVSSVIVLKRLPRHPVFKRRIKLPLRFFLELLTLLLLTLAAASPALRAGGEHIALVIDNSMSMGAEEAGRKRFEEAATWAEDFLLDSSRANRYTLYTVSPKLTRVSEEQLDRDRARQALKEIVLTDTTDAIQEALIELAESGKFDRVVTVTDQEPEYLPGSGTLSLDVFSRLATVDVRRVGRPAVNAYLANARFEPSALKEGSVEVVAAVGVSGSRPLDIRTELFEVERSEREHLVSTTVVRAQSDRLTEVKFAISGVSASRLFVIRISPGGEGERDALEVDNQGWVSSGAKGGTGVLLVGGAGETTLGLERIRGLAVRPISPSEFGRLPERDLSQYSLLVFHRSAPTFVPKVSTLLVLPPRENPLFPVRGAVESPVVSSWQESDPLTAYLKLNLLQPRGGQVFSVPPWARSVINVEEGSLVAAGESERVRFAAVGTELFPFEGAATPVVSVLTLNLVNWLTGGEELGLSSLTGSTLRLEPGLEWQVTEPNGRELRMSSSAQEPSFLTLAHPGAYALRGVEPRGLGLIAQRTVTANAFHFEESATFARHAVSVPRQVAAASEQPQERNQFWRLLAIAAFIVLLTDILLQVQWRRRSDAGISL